MSKDLNVPQALEWLGDLYLWGIGTDKNIKEAVNCYLRLVELGAIQYALYIFHISHKFNEDINFDEVVRIFEKQNNNFSTDNADADAIKGYNLLKFMLACCYYWGVGTKQNKERAKQLLMSAGYDFNEDNTPLFIKENTMAYPFPNKNPICSEFFIPLQKKYFDLTFNKPFRELYPFLNRYNPAKYSKTKELYNFFKELDDKDLDYFLEAVSVDNANYMRDALEEDNYPDFRQVCSKEPNFAGYVFFIIK